MVPFKIAESGHYRVLAKRADKLTQRVIIEGDIVVHNSDKYKREVYRVVSVLTKANYHRDLAYRVFNVKRQRVLTDAVFFREHIYLIPGVDGMIEEMLSGGKYKNTETMFAQYLKWLAKNDYYRKRFKGFYAEFLAFFMQKVYKANFSIRANDWLVK